MSELDNSKDLFGALELDLDPSVERGTSPEKPAPEPTPEPVIIPEPEFRAEADNVQAVGLEAEEDDVGTMYIERGIYVPKVFSRSSESFNDATFELRQQGEVTIQELRDCLTLAGLTYIDLPTSKGHKHYLMKACNKIASQEGFVCKSSSKSTTCAYTFGDVSDLALGEVGDAFGARQNKFYVRDDYFSRLSCEGDERIIELVVAEFDRLYAGETLKAFEVKKWYKSILIKEFDGIDLQFAPKGVPVRSNPNTGYNLAKGIASVLNELVEHLADAMDRTGEIGTRTANNVNEKARAQMPRITVNREILGVHFEKLNKTCEDLQWSVRRFFNTTEIRAKLIELDPLPE